MRNEERITEKHREGEQYSYSLVPYIIHASNQIQDGKLAQKMNGIWGGRINNHL